jgi:hypothetical protein
MAQSLRRPGSEDLQRAQAHASHQPGQPAAVDAGPGPRRRPGAAAVDRDVDREQPMLDRHYGHFPLPPNELSANAAAALPPVVLLEHARTLYVSLNATHGAWATVRGEGAVMCEGGWWQFAARKGVRSTTFLVWQRANLSADCPSYVYLGNRGWCAAARTPAYAAALASRVHDSSAGTS